MTLAPRHYLLNNILPYIVVCKKNISWNLLVSLKTFLEPLKFQALSTNGKMMLSSNVIRSVSRFYFPATKSLHYHQPCAVVVIRCGSGYI